MGWIAEPELLAALDSGALVITGNERLARNLGRLWDERQRARAETSWEPANVLSWSSWTSALWAKLLLAGHATALLLTPLQEEHLWRRVIAADTTAAASLLGQQALARLAMEAWRPLCSYAGEERLLGSAHLLQGDAASFARWARAFLDDCAERSMLSRPRLEAELARHVEQKHLPHLSGDLHLLGFDHLSPARQLLLEALRKQGSTIVATVDPQPRGGLLAQARDEQDELRSAARWIRTQLAANPSASIGLIVNDLEQQMEPLRAILRETLAPGNDGIDQATVEPPFEFSLGRTLAHESMVRTALDLLQWATGPLPLDRVSRLLQSPHFAASPAESTARAEFDAGALRSTLRLRPELTLAELLAEFRIAHRRSAAFVDRLPHLADIAHRLAAAQTRLDLRPRNYSEWTEWMRLWLSLAQWQTEDAPSSRDYQLRERWEAALDAVAALDSLGESVSLDQALSAVQGIVRDTIFAPASLHAPIQIMGPIEAAGSHFDALWVLHAGEMHWPLRSAAQPLLPWFLQRELRMPGADAANDRARAEQLTQRLAGSADTVVFSYARHLPSGRHQTVAAIVGALSLDSVDIYDLAGEEPPRRRVELERFHDNTAISPLPDKQHRGGARLFELQAACSFRAFAELRLGAADLETRDLGLNTLERGSAVHAALENFWKQVGGQHELRVMPPQQRDDLVRGAVATALERSSRKINGTWDAAYIGTQRGRLEQLLQDWLELELTRPEFTVAQQEEKQEVRIGNLSLSLRVDRVDLVDGHRVILDYKTGEAKTSEWLGDRPDKPQVPLYAILASEAAAQDPDSVAPLGAVGFAQVRAGLDMKLRGFAGSSDLLHAATAKAKPARMDADTFEAQVERWHTVLTQLAEAFSSGEALVEPKQFSATCERCGQRILCRVDAATFDEQLADEPRLDGEDHNG